jgi:hypothetical protein
MYSSLEKNTFSNCVSEFQVSRSPNLARITVDAFVANMALERVEIVDNQEWA